MSREGNGQTGHRMLTANRIRLAVGFIPPDTRLFPKGMSEMEMKTNKKAFPLPLFSHIILAPVVSALCLYRDGEEETAERDSKMSNEDSVSQRCKGTALGLYARVAAASHISIK